MQPASCMKWWNNTNAVVFERHGEGLPMVAYVLLLVAGNFCRAGKDVANRHECGEVSTRGEKAPPIQITVGEGKHYRMWDWFRLNWSVQ